MDAKTIDIPKCGLSRPPDEIPNLAKLLANDWTYEQRSTESGYEWGMLSFNVGVRDSEHASRVLNSLRAELLKLTS